MKKLLIPTVACTLIFFSCSQSADTDPCATFDQLDRQMLDLIQEIKDTHATDVKFLEEFNMEQVFWIQYRDTHLRAIYPKDWDRHYRQNFGKEIFNPCKCKEMVRMTRLRIRELELWKTGGPVQQNECPSQWR